MEKSLRRRTSAASVASAATPRLDRQESDESQESYKNASQNSYTEMTQTFDNALCITSPKPQTPNAQAQQTQQAQQEPQEAKTQAQPIAMRTRASALSIAIPSHPTCLISPSTSNNAASAQSAMIGLSANSPIALSIGIVSVMKRPSTHKKQKNIKPFALQKSFYAYPKNVDQQTMEKINTRVQNDIADFKLQGYDVTTHTFGLPFEVEEVCCVSRGYNLLPKILKAPKIVGKKRKTTSDDEESSDSDEDDGDGDDTYMAAAARTSTITERASASSDKNKKIKK